MLNTDVRVENISCPLCYSRLLHTSEHLVISNTTSIIYDLSVVVPVNEVMYSIVQKSISLNIDLVFINSRIKEWICLPLDSKE